MAKEFPPSFPPSERYVPSYTFEFPECIIYAYDQDEQKIMVRYTKDRDYNACEGMFDEVGRGLAWSSELRCSNNLKLTTKHLVGNKVVGVEYHEFDKEGVPLPLGVKKGETSGQEGKNMYQLLYMSLLLSYRFLLLT